ncbi:unnamed protein product [Protopolystoma xenopodis]|uniref:Uncharacterized protein n=1 Tax=Protopolystoma xenopodis TaxID=117903 RepID=A0A3S5AVF9_9PLAT|nr:unnamed protein product [Protopolystoma xenopodis]
MALRAFLVFFPPYLSHFRKLTFRASDLSEIVIKANGALSVQTNKLTSPKALITGTAADSYYLDENKCFIPKTASERHCVAHFCIPPGKGPLDLQNIENNSTHIWSGGPVLMRDTKVDHLALVSTSSVVLEKLASKTIKLDIKGTLRADLIKCQSAEISLVGPSVSIQAIYCDELTLIASASHCETALTKIDIGSAHGFIKIQLDDLSDCLIGNQRKFAIDCLYQAPLKVAWSIVSDWEN